MTHKLLKVDGYWIVVSDEISGFENNILVYNNGRIWVWQNTMAIRSNNRPKQIMYSQNLEHNLPTIPFSDEMAKELGIVDVKKLGAELASKRRIKFQSEFEDGVCSGLEEGFEIGYNQCLSDNVDKKFTLDDIKRVMFKVYINGIRNPKDGKESFGEISNRIIQSLTKEEYFCELEMETTIIKQNQCVNKCASYPSECLCEMTKTTQPKITNNSVKIIKIWK